MIVVADTTPLNYLIRLGYIDILPQLYGSILVPIAVLAEMQSPRAPSDVRAWALSPPLWVERPKAVRLEPTLHKSLGAGEREAISIAITRHADLVLIDELLGREEVVSRGLAVTGTLAILQEIALSNSLELPEILHRLRRLGFRFSHTLESEIIARYTARLKS